MRRVMMNNHRTEQDQIIRQLWQISDTFRNFINLVENNYNTVTKRSAPIAGNGFNGATKRLWAT